MTPAPCRCQLRLVQVGMLGNVSAALVQLDGACSGWTWEALSHKPLPEFLGDPYLEIPAGTPVIRLDRLADSRVGEILRGPHWDAHLPDGHIRPAGSFARPYAGESWADLRRCDLAPDVYARVAPSAGVSVAHLAGNTTQPAPAAERHGR